MIIRSLIIVPTYNEAPNIIRLIDAIFAEQDDDHRFDVLVVDDSSPDGTSALVSERVARDRSVFLITRPEKDGRGGAVLFGFQFALRRGCYDNVVEMDGDFSHDPMQLRQLINKNCDSDLTIGSRYASGSKIIGWTLGRRIFSRMANFYARSTLSIPLSDYTNGFRCYKLSTLKMLDFSKLRSKGYILLSELAYQLYLKHAKFAEVPIVFVNRKRGSSNFSLKEVKEAFFAIPKIYKNYREERRRYRRGVN